MHDLIYYPLLFCAFALVTLVAGVVIAKLITNATEEFENLHNSIECCKKEFKKSSLWEWMEKVADKLENLLSKC